MKYLTILDFYNGHIYTYAIASNDWQHEEIEQFLSSQGFRINNIEYMFHNNKPKYINETIY